MKQVGQQDRKTKVVNNEHGNRKGSSFLFPIIIVVLLGIIAFSGYKVISILSERVEGEKIYEQQDEYISVDRHETEETDFREFVKKAPNIYVNFEKLMEGNPDICGWIIFPNTRINYPIVKGKNNDYYLSHTSTKQKNSCGAIFMDMNSDREFNDAKTIIYGHRMNNGSMFENLLKYRDQKFYDVNPAGILLTPDGNYMLSIVSAKEIKDDLKYYRTGFVHDDEYQEEIDILTSGSFIQCTDSADREDRILMLSTCVKGSSSKRFIVICRLVDMDSYFNS